MANKFNPYSAVNDIHTLKGQWDEADKAGDTKKKQEISNSALAAYDMLRSNGYSDVADRLSQSSYEESKAIVDNYSKYFKDNDNSTNYTEQQLQNMTDNLIYRENENLFKRYGQEYDDFKSTNPFETAEGKFILAKYDLAGLQGRDNAAANGGASNGGNIDSYAANQALRQQAALTAMGQEMALNVYQRKLDHARGLLSDMGVNIDRVFNQNETSKNNDVARKQIIAEVTGYSPREWVAQNNPFLNSDGTLKNENLDYTTLIANFEKNGDKEAAQYAKVARGIKILGDYSKYGKYDDGNYSVMGGTPTEARRQFDETNKLANKQLDNEKELSEAELLLKKYGYDVEKKISDDNNATARYGYDSQRQSNNYANAINKYGIDKEAELALALKDKENKLSGITASQIISDLKNTLNPSQALIDAYNALGLEDKQYTTKNPPAFTGANIDKEDDFGVSIDETGELVIGDTDTGGSNTQLSEDEEAKWTTFRDSFDKNGVKRFLDDYVKKNIYAKVGIKEDDVLETNLINAIKDSTDDYNIDVDDATRILNNFGYDTSWLNEYTNRTWFDMWKGMKKKKK